MSSIQIVQTLVMLPLLAVLLILVLGIAWNWVTGHDHDTTNQGE